MANIGSYDYGRELVDKELQELEERLGNLYTAATYELDEKLSSYFAKFADEDEKMLAQLAAGKITDSQYEAWRRGRIIGQESWFNMRDRLAQDLTHVDQIAATMINDQLPSMYATSYNFGAFDMEMQSAVMNVDLSPFTIYNTEAVKMLMRDDPDLLPSLAFNRNLDLQWNRRHIQSAIAQGIIQGDSMDKIADRLQRVTAMDRNAALRNARTATNGTENAGRQAIADQCVAQGIPMIKEWNAVKDARTRDSHLLVDGEQVEEDKPFSNGLMKAGDPHGDPTEVYNCRCATLHFIKGIDHSRDFERYQEMMQEENYDDWLRARQAEQDEDSWWHNKNLEQEYGRERQARLRGQIADTWDDTLTEAEVRDEMDQLFGKHLLEVTKPRHNTMPYLDGVSELYKTSDRKMRYHDEAIRATSSRNKVSEEEAQQLLNSAMQRLVDDSNFGTRIDADVLIQVLDDQRFKNQFETGSSKGLLSTLNRTRCESSVFGVPEDTSPADRPVYGMLFPRVDDWDEIDKAAENFYLRGRGDWYGNCTVIYKKADIVDNTTITLGDSLDRSYNLGATLASNPVYTSGLSGEDVVDMMELYENGSSGGNYVTGLTDRLRTYIEIQLHGVETHSIDNIEMVVLKTGAPSATELASKLDAMGIPYVWL